MPIINRHTGQIEGDGELLTANITLRCTRLGFRIPVFYAAYGENIYKATLIAFHSRIDDLLLGTNSDSHFIEISFWKDKDTIWRERHTVEDMKEFYEQWNVVDRRVLIEKTGCI